jgi:predicted DNA-binding transcriptional regulator YafY
MAKVSRVPRLLKLVGLLQGGKGHNANSLAAELGVGRRSVFRYLDVLREAGVPVEFNEARGHYSIPETYFLAPTSLSPDEALRALVLCHELGGDLPYYGPAREAAVKLANSLPEDVRDYLRNVTGAVKVRLGSGVQNHQEEDVYHALVDALAKRRRVHIRYQSLTPDEPLTVSLAPYRLLFSRHSWYVIGHVAEHDDIRTFHLGRIGEINPTDDAYSIPRGFDLDRFLGNAWSLMREPGPDQDVHLRFSPMVARNVAAVKWHKTQMLDWNEDGSLDFYVRTAGLTEIHWWILGYADQVEVIAPQALRDKVAARARALAEIYADQ